MPDQERSKLVIPNSRTSSMTPCLRVMKIFTYHGNLGEIILIHGLGPTMMSPRADCDLEGRTFIDDGLFLLVSLSNRHTRCTHNFNHVMLLDRVQGSVELDRGRRERHWNWKMKPLLVVELDHRTQLDCRALLMGLSLVKIQ